MNELSEGLGDLFKPFGRLPHVGDERGFGLGLGLVKAVIERLEGDIAVQSKLGEGALFIVRLPVHAAQR